MKISELEELLGKMKLVTGDVEVTCTGFDGSEAYETTVENIGHYEDGDGIERPLDFPRIRLML